MFQREWSIESEFFSCRSNNGEKQPTFLSGESLIYKPDLHQDKRLRAQFAAREPRLPAIFYQMVAIASKAVSSEPALLKKLIAADPALKQLAFILFAHCHLILLAVSRFGYIEYRPLKCPAALLARRPLQ